MVESVSDCNACPHSVAACVRVSNADANFPVYIDGVSSDKIGQRMTCGVDLDITRISEPNSMLL